MRFVMNERKFAEALINGELVVKNQNKSYSVGIVAKYYKAIGYNDSEIKTAVKNLINDKFPQTTEKYIDSLVNRSLKMAKKFPLYEIDEIVITKPEIELINTLHSNDFRDRSIRRLAFTLLCFTKFEAMKGAKGDWVNIELKRIFSAADIKNITRKKQSLMIHALYSLGYIDLSQRLDNHHIKVLGLKDGETEISVTNIDECGYIFEEYNGEKFVRCADCGIMVRATSGRTKRCPDCAEERNRELARERMRKRRYAK